MKFEIERKQTLDGDKITIEKIKIETLKDLMRFVGKKGENLLIGKKIVLIKKKREPHLILIDDIFFIN